MDVSTLSPILPGPVGSPKDDKAGLDGSRSTGAADFDSFLKLLTAQLRNQDPLSPLDSTEFVAQLASFSSVEQLIGANERLEALSTQMLNRDVAAFANWIGRDVVVNDGSFRASGGAISFPVPALEDAERVEAVVRDAFGTELRRLDVTGSLGGAAGWDGKDQLGVAVSGRDLKIGLTYYRGGTAVESRPAEVGRTVVGIRGTDDGLLLEFADGGSVSPQRVSRVSEATPG